MLFWLLVSLPIVRGGIDFMDCGSKNMIVDKIDIPGCEHVPCRIYKGNSYHFYITPDLIGHRASRLITHASVVMWGAHIPIPTECEYPCITTFPFRPRWRKPRLNVTVKFPPMLLGRPAELYLWAKSTNPIRNENDFCVTLQIDIF